MILQFSRCPITLCYLDHFGSSARCRIVFASALLQFELLIMEAHRPLLAIHYDIIAMSFQKIEQTCVIFKSAASD